MKRCTQCIRYLAPDASNYVQRAIYPHMQPMADFPPAKCAALRMMIMADTLLLTAFLLKTRLPRRSTRRGRSTSST